MKIPLFFLFLFLPATLYSIEFRGNAEIGYIPESEAIVTALNLNIIPWNWCRITVGIETLMDYAGFGASGLSFNPYRTAYLFDLHIYPLNWLYLKLEHTCTHPVYSRIEQFYDKFEGGNRTTYSLGISW